MDHTGIRDTSRYFPVRVIPQDMFQSVNLQSRLAGRGLHQALPVVYTLTECDYTGKFGTKHAALKVISYVYHSWHEMVFNVLMCR